MCGGGGDQGVVCLLTLLQVMWYEMRLNNVVYELVVVTSAVIHRKLVARSIWAGYFHADLTLTDSQLPCRAHKKPIVAARNGSIRRKIFSETKKSVITLQNKLHALYKQRF